MSFQAENALENAPVAIAITSLAGYVLYANKFFLELFALDQEDVAARNHHIVQVAGQRIHASFLDTVIKYGEPQQARVSFAISDGVKRDFYCSARCIVEHDIPTSLMWVLQDASQVSLESNRLQAEAMDMLAAQRLIGAFSWRLLLDNAAQPTDNPVQWSAEVYGLLGEATRGMAMTTESYLKLVVPEDRQGFVDAIGRAVADSGSYVYHYALKRPDGALLSMRSCGAVVTAADTAVRVLIGMEVNITKLALPVREAQGQEWRMQALIDELDGPAFILDRKLRYVGFNAAYTSLVAMQKDAPPQIGALFLNAIADPLRQRHYRSIFTRVFTGERIVEEAVVNGHDASSRRWLDYAFSPVKNGDGQVENALALGRDVSLIRRAEQRRKRLDADIEQAVARRTEELVSLKREFNEAIYHTADELLALQETLSAPSNAQQVRQAATTRMQLLLHDMQQLAQVGEHILTVDAIDSQRLVQTVVKEARMMEGYEVDIEQLPVVHCDPFLLGLVFGRLIDNAVRCSRHRKPGRIRIRCTQRARDAVWVITDNGAGFCEDESQQIFIPFFQPRGIRDRQGSGLELTIVKQAVQRMAGRVWAHGEPDRGATFYFVIGQQSEAQRKA